MYGILVCVNSIGPKTPGVALLACNAIIIEALRTHRRNILIKAAVGLSGALLTPVLVGAVATLMMFYIVIWIIVVGSASVAIHIGLAIFAVWVLFYGGLMIVAWKREWTTRIFFYQSSERRPPVDLFPLTVKSPRFYIPLGMDLLQEDIPPHWVIRIACYWADIMVKARLQWDVYRFAAQADRVPAAEIILAISQATGASIQVDPLINDRMTHEQLHAAICVLIILDIAALNTDWSKIWLNRAVREKLGLNPEPGKKQQIHSPYSRPGRS